MKEKDKTLSEMQIIINALKELCQGQNYLLLDNKQLLKKLDEFELIRNHFKSFIISNDKQIRFASQNIIFLSSKMSKNMKAKIEGTSIEEIDNIMLDSLSIMMEDVEDKLKKSATELLSELY